MSLILHIETSTATCSVALSENGNLLASLDKTERNIHASSLTLFIQDVLKQAKRNIKELAAISISMGPGSYTGLRIGVSTAKGLCYGLDIPLIAVNTLEAMANGFKNRCFSVNKQTLFCPMIDARRMEVYSAVFDDELNMVKGVEAVIIDEQSFKDLLDTHIIYFFGDGAAKCEEVLGTHLNARVLDIYVNNAADMISIAQEKFDNKNFVDVAYFEPFYLKDYIAGVKRPVS